MPIVVKRGRQRRVRQPAGEGWGVSDTPHALGLFCLPLKARMGATHFRSTTRSRPYTEMALDALAFTLNPVLNITGTGHVMTA